MRWGSAKPCLKPQTHELDHFPSNPALRMKAQDPLHADNTGMHSACCVAAKQFVAFPIPPKLLRAFPTTAHVFSSDPCSSPSTCSMLFCAWMGGSTSLISWACLTLPRQPGSAAAATREAAPAGLSVKQPAAPPHWLLTWMLVLPVLLCSSALGSRWMLAFCWFCCCCCCCWGRGSDLAGMDTDVFD